MKTLFLALITSLALSFFSLPSIIRIFPKKNLFDEPDIRKKHNANIPTLGGVVIFGALIFSLTFLSNQKLILELQYIIASLILLFFVGVKDDLLNIRAHKKLVVQITSAFIIVNWTDIKLTNFFGLFGIHEIHLIPSYIVSIIAIVFITNAFNLIDGIDGLAGSLGILASLFFGTWFALIESYQFALLAFSLTGALLGFLFYNWSPAKIFMGDTGSLIVGFIISLLAIKFIEVNRHMTKTDAYKIVSVPVVTISVLIIPIFDTIRIVVLRLLKRQSPFSPDRNHVHHLLIDAGASHAQAVLSLVALNMLTFSIALLLQGKIKSEILLAIVLLTPTLFIKKIEGIKNHKRTAILE